MRIRPALALITLLACSSIASAQATLKVGDAAPPLTVGKWVRGKPVEKFEAGTVYVMEFWATWCGPCKAAMPHLAKLQADHPEIVIIAQDVGEEDKESSKVEAWIADLGDQMKGLRVATDDRSGDDEGKMFVAWNQAARAETLPATFVIDKEGKIAWIGRPDGAREAVEQLLAGTFDRDAAKKQSAAKNADQQSMQALQAELNDSVGPLLGEKDYIGAAKAVDPIIAAHPEKKGYLLGVKFGLQLKAQSYDDAYATADLIAAEANDDAQTLGSLALAMVDGQGIEKRDYARAERYATRAVELTDTKDAHQLDTLARVHAEQGYFDKAADTMKKAVAVADDEQKPQLEKTLEAYEAKAK